MAKRHWYHYLIGLAILAAMWEALALGMHTPAMPRLAEALKAFGQSVTEGPLLGHFGISLYRVTISTLISLVLGVPLGLYLGRTGGAIGNVLVYLTHPIPKVVFLPVIIVAVGIGDASKILVITLVIFFQIVVTVKDAASSVGRGLIRSVQSLGGGEWAIFRHVILPASLPGIFTALRLSTGTAVAVLFFAETYATKLGLGALVWDAWSMRNYGLMFAGVMTMALLGFGFYVLLDWLERLVCPWAEAQR
ncbi:MAG TPA: ABC transporter permease [Symbiobacteriaceae bacterium]|jgi:NitT/TauT family transport system permease protein|nr:ABC transporter permease [Symbiobacteriaceae bacterium]